jgi:hypothetical protein
MSKDHFDPLDVEESWPPRRKDGGREDSASADFDPLDMDVTLRPDPPQRSAGVEDTLDLDETMPRRGEVFDPSDMEETIPWHGGSYRAKLIHPSGKVTFLIAKNEIGFGKDSHKKNPNVDVPLRLLPCRSKTLDTDNWNQSLKISGLHGRFRCSDGKMQLFHRSSNGIYFVLSGSDDFDDLNGTVPEDSPAESFEGENLVPVPKGIWVDLPDHCVLSLGKKILRLETQVYKDWEDSSRVAAFRIRRRSNTVEYEYVQVFTEALLGGPAFVISVGEDFTERVAGLHYERGRFCFTCYRSDNLIGVQERSIAARYGGVCPFENDRSFGHEISVGVQHYLFKYATDDDFTKADDLPINCSGNFDRFIELARQQRPCFYDDDKEMSPSVVRYEIEPCGRLTKSFVKFDPSEPKLVLDLMMNKKMSVSYPSGRFKDEWVNGLMVGLDDFDGELKEALLELMVYKEMADQRSKENIGLEDTL